MSIAAPEQQIPRDRYGRPLVKPENGGKPIPYTRCTTYVGVLEDTYNLSRWQQRMVALGLSQRPDLLLAVTSTEPDDKAKLNGLCEDAMEAAKAHAAATTGTALHALTERIDRGQDVGVVPEAYIADLAAYQHATEALTATHIEAFCVLDPYQIGGTPDRVVRYQGKSYIADVKTGSIEWGTLKIAMQLAVYARSKTYDIATGERGIHDAELDKGLIIHLPAGRGECTLHWVDLLAGWEAVKIAKQVREKRTLKFSDLTEPFSPAPEPEPVKAERQQEDADADLAAAIEHAESVEALMVIWEKHHAAFTQTHIDLAVAVKERLQRGTTAA